MEIVKNSKNNGTLVFKEISYQEAKSMIIENHYSKKWNTSFGKINIGVFRDNQLLGCAVFGNLMNPNSYKTLNDGFNKDSLTELNRLWISDELGHNSETMLLGASFKIIRKLYPEIQAVQSFADGRLGCGTIYKAANFNYYGYNKSLFFEDIDTGEVFHKVPLENTKRPQGFIGKNLRYIDGKLKPFHVKTYRYIYPLYKNVTINLKEEKYPEYDIGIEYTNFTHSIGLLCRLYLMMVLVDSEHHYTKKIYKQIESSFDKDDIDKHIKQQRLNASVIWFETTYLKNNTSKILNILNVHEQLT